MDTTTIIQEELLIKARALVQEIEAGNDTQMNSLLEDIGKLRESSLFQELGRMTRELHESLNGFRFDSRITDLAEHEIPDAKERLNYVIEMTNKAAHRTMSMVEETIPLSDKLEKLGNDLTQKWQRLMRREMDVNEFKKLSHEIGEFLPLVEEHATKIHANLSEMMIAQDYQDITGQILGRVITLVQNMEDNLVNMIRISGGRLEVLPVAPRVVQKLEGPQIHPQGRADVVDGQDNVDALLSSLGF